MKLRNASYERLARQTQSQGKSVLYMDSPRLIELLVRDVCERILRELKSGRFDTDSDQRQTRTELRIDDYFDRFAPYQIHTPTTVRGLRQLADAADDLADERGQWTEIGDELEISSGEAEAAALAAAKQRLLVVTNERGFAACASELRNISDDLLREIAAPGEAPQDWTTDRNHQLHHDGAELRGLARPRTVWAKVLLACKADAPLFWWLPKRQRDRLPALVDRVQRAALDRYGRLEREARERLARRLLGSDDRAGLLQQLAAKLLRTVEYFQQLLEALPASRERNQSPLHHLELVQNLNALVDSTSRTTLRDLYERILQRHGKDAHSLAQSLWSNGLLIDGEYVRPAQWKRHPLSRVAKHLFEHVCKQLGLPEQQTSSGESASTVYCELADITPAHPALREILRRKIPEWVRMSGPYLEAPDVTGGQPTLQCYLRCHPSQRRLLEELLANHVRPAPSEPNGHALGPFDHASAYRMELVRCAFGIAGGAQISLQRGMFQLNRLQAQGRLTPLEDLSKFHEMRYLAQMPSGHDDARQIFRCLERCGAIRSIKSDPPRFALARSEPMLDDLFFSIRLQPIVQTAEHFQRQLVDPTFTDFVEVQFRVAEFHQLALRISRLPHPNQAAAELVKLGVLTPLEGGLYRMAGPIPKKPALAPTSVYKRRRGSLVGMTRAEFIRHLMEFDDFYNVMAWRVVDAIADLRLNPSEATEFLRDYVDRHLA